MLKEYQTYKNLKHLIYSIKILEMDKLEDTKEATKLYLYILKSTSEKIKNGNKYIKAYADNKKYYKEILILLKKLNKDFKGLVEKFEKSLKLKDISGVCETYLKIEKHIIENVTLWKLHLDDERDLVKLLITILYNGGSFYRKIPYQGFWGNITQYKEEATKNVKNYKDPVKRVITRERRKFEKLFRYYFWDEDKDEFILSDLSKQTKKGKFKGGIAFPISQFLDSDSFLIKFAKKVMKSNSTKPTEEKNHVYLSITKFGNHNRIYIGKAKEKNGTRHRWGYGSGHLFEVFHYIVRKGKYNFPRQLTDLWTLYFGPETQIILTLISDVTIVPNKVTLDNVEKAYQYFFEFEKDKLDVQGYTHEKLSYKSKDELPKKLKDIYETILIKFTF